LPFLVSAAGVLSENLFATLFPSDCRLCGEPLVNISRLPVCAECISRLQPIDGLLCSICGERIFSPCASESPALACGLCRRAAPPFARAVAYGSYERELRGLIDLLKYEGVLPAKKVLGRILAEAIVRFGEEFGPEVLLVPVPLHASKKRQRGFNQTEIVAGEAIKLIRNRGLHFDSTVLVRRRNTESQIGLTRHQRRENMRGAFSIVNRAAVQEREVLLVDDVFTTGTTISECSKVLLRAGATKVWVATIARTLKAEAQIGEVGERVSIQALKAAM
jgi:ComF family protein